jgi:hypothetical protein
VIELKVATCSKGFCGFRPRKCGQLIERTHTTRLFTVYV